MKNPLVVLFLMLPAWAAAAALPACATQAAAEFSVPAKLFTALVIQARDQAPQINEHTGKSGEFGPMKLSQKAIEQAAPVLRTTGEAIRQNPCENYRAAAWWLSTLSRGKNKGDTWGAVNRYFYKARPQNSSGYEMSNSVKQIYKNL